MPTDAKSKYRFRKLLEELGSKRGRGTELISVYITPDFDLAKVLQQLRDEQGTASNIKSKSTRKNVLAALERIIQFLRTYSETSRRPPPNGMAIFAGNVAGREDYVDVQLYWVEPPEPITVRMYRCDQEFDIKPLREMLQIKETLGILVMDGKETSIATLRGKHVDIVRRLTSAVPGKHSKGGQSARRFERLREIAVHEYRKRVAEAANEIFSNIPDLRAILVGGPGPMKDEFLKLELLRPDIKEKVIGVFDTGYTDEQGVKEIVNKAGEALADLEILKEKALVQRFFEELVAGEGLVAYGEGEIRNALERGSVDTLMISDEFRKNRVNVRCEKCGNGFHKTVENVEQYKRQLLNLACSKCGEFQLSVTKSADVTQELLELAEKSNAKVEFISTETEEGKQLRMAFKGLAAILRFKIAA
jgi:peptide chain release factor subunit 1